MLWLQAPSLCPPPDTRVGICDNCYCNVHPTHGLQHRQGLNTGKQGTALFLFQPKYFCNISLFKILFTYKCQWEMHSQQTGWWDQSLETNHLTTMVQKQSIFTINIDTMFCRAPYVSVIAMLILRRLFITHNLIIMCMKFVSIDKKTFI